MIQKLLCYDDCRWKQYCATYSKVDILKRFAITITQMIPMSKAWQPQGNMVTPLTLQLSFYLRPPSRLSRLAIYTAKHSTMVGDGASVYFR
ncbi:hypothetical protein IG631_13194 [Alternaria alternata]|nr:hypothetical protein IG631_13194 [Alternaria alternata]